MRSLHIYNHNTVHPFYSAVTVEIIRDRPQWVFNEYKCITDASARRVQNVINKMMSNGNNNSEVEIDNGRVSLLVWENENVWECEK